MADDVTSGWDANIAGLERLAANIDGIERNALKAAATAVAPRLAEAAPLRVSEKQGGSSLPEGALRDAVRPRVVVDRDTGRLQALIDFGKLTWIAHIVDIGHTAPYVKLAKKLGRTVTGKNTPAHPFVRAVQDSQRETAETAYRAAMSEGINAALKGEK